MTLATPRAVPRSAAGRRQLLPRRATIGLAGRDPPWVNAGTHPLNTLTTEHMTTDPDHRTP